jgi:hypothetical protein
VEKLCSITKDSTPTDTDSESKTISHLTADNGSRSTQELNPLDLSTSETSLLPQTPIKRCNITQLLSFKDGEPTNKRCTNNLPTSMEEAETSETQVECAWVPNQTPTLITKKSDGTYALTTVLKDGNLTLREFTTQRTHSEMVLGSRSRQ